MSSYLPDGCLWNSDLDYYEAMNPTEREVVDEFSYDDESGEEAGREDDGDENRAGSDSASPTRRTA